MPQRKPVSPSNACMHSALTLPGAAELCFARLRICKQWSACGWCPLACSRAVRAWLRSVAASFQARQAKWMLCESCTLLRW